MGVRQGRFVTKSEKDQLKERDEKLSKIRNTFAEARSYAKAKGTENQKGMPYHDSDLRLDAMIPVLQKEMPILLHAHGIKQIQAALDWAIDEDLKIILLAGQDVRFATSMLKENKIPVIYEGTLTTPSRRWEPYDAPI